MVAVVIDEGRQVLAASTPTPLALSHFRAGGIRYGIGIFGNPFQQELGYKCLDIIVVGRRSIAICSIIRLQRRNRNNGGGSTGKKGRGSVDRRSKGRTVVITLVGQF